tara:strand:+ start:5404 stop:7770 length:2367 start_codon:yes stop_codon:yes gene_type:complete
MAERIVSPGVFTNEIDVSFLPAAISELGAALIGVCDRGPAFTPTQVESFADFEVKFGSVNKDLYLPYAAKSYLKNSGTATIVRVLGTQGYTVKHGIQLAVTESSGDTILCSLYPQKNTAQTEFDLAAVVTESATGDSLNQVGSFVVDWVGDGSNLSPTMSLNSADSNYVLDVLGGSPNTAYATNVPAYVHAIWKESADSFNKTGSISFYTGSASSITYGTSTNGYAAAQTPMITGPQAGSGDAVELFRFKTLSDGDASNQFIKVGISNIRGAADVAGSDFGSFDVIVRTFDDTDKKANVLETFTACNLDASSPNYVVRKIGDMVSAYDFTTSKVNVTGDYEVKSKYIRVTDVNDQIKNGIIGETLNPFGFKGYAAPINSGSDPNATEMASLVTRNIPDMPYLLNQSGSDSTFNSKYYHGVAFDSSSRKNDIYPYLNATVDTTHLSSSNFALDTHVGLTINSSLNNKKFIMGFQGGFDGWDPRYNGGAYHGLGKANPANTNDNSDNDITSWKNAIATVSNPDEIDINMLVMPGITIKNHGKVYTNARDMVEDRGDTFLVVDPGGYTNTLAEVKDAVSTEDTNYVATYYPWVKIRDEISDLNVWVPPSVVLPGIIAYTDKVSHPWFAPAGLNRGGLTEALMAKERLTHDERDTLYEGRVNPIASFPGEGVVVWGQKTLQTKPSALDRVNVRRLLIALKKFVASTSRFLVFEQNNSSLRNRFLNIVNPYLETVQSQSGLNAFRVVMDDSNNTPDVVDRNELKGQLFIQPTKTAEFIVLDFIVQPTGASFPE